MNLEFFVRDKRLTRKGREPLVGDTAGHYTFTIEFDEEWEGLAIVVVFRNGSDSAQLLYRGQTNLPAAVSGRGDLYVACHGYRKLGDSVAVLRTIRMSHPVRLLGSEPMAGDDSGEYTPTLFEQVMAAAAKAETAAANLLDLRDSGALTGPAGPRGLPGPQGPAGSKGETGPTGATGPQGPAGADGTSFVVRDRYETLSALNAAHQTGAEGDAYAVGTEEDNVIYIWGADVNDWVSMGSLQGPAGLQGPQGIQGVQGEQGPKGDTGPTGPEGPKGDTGEQGPEGPQGPAGADGKTPVKGTDYFTEADKQELAQAAAALVEIPSTPPAHNQSASTITAGTFAGQVAANSSGQDPGTSLLRNSKLVSADTAPAVNGEICWKYE